MRSTGPLRLFSPPSALRTAPLILSAVLLGGVALFGLAEGGCAKVDQMPISGSGGNNPGSGSGGRGGVINPGTGGALPTTPVMGKMMGATITPGDITKLDGSPKGSFDLAYPLDGAIFPSNFGPVTVQAARSQGQDIARVNFAGNQLDLQYYDTCSTTVSVGGGCYVRLSAEMTRLFLSASATDDIVMTVRVGSRAGSTLTESKPIKVAWANVGLSVRW